MAAGCTVAASAAGAAPPARVHGVTTMQGGTLRLPGVEVAVRRGDGTVAATVVSDGDGAYSIDALEPGVYRFTASLAGVAEPLTRSVTVTAGQDREENFDLALAKVSERVEVLGQAGQAESTASSAQQIQGKLIDVLPVRGDDYKALLPVVPGVVRGPDGKINMKGGRAPQTGLQASNMYASDPSTGGTGFELPVDAVESVEALANPFAAEYGRFSSGVVRIETRRGGDAWTVTANNFIPVPCLKLCDGVHWGIRSYDPRLLFGGPLIKGRLFLAQSFQYHNHKDMVTSLPEGSNDIAVQAFESFTRVDASLGKHAVTASGAFYPRHVDSVNLNTFNPQPVAADFRQHGYYVSVADTTTLSAAAIVESTVSVKRYDVEIVPGDDLAMEWWPDGNRGSFFNWQLRRTRTVQWVETATVVRKDRSGEHVLKVGLDLLAASYTGTSESRPVVVRRANGTAAWRVDFSGLSSQAASSTDVAWYVQDRWRATDRVAFELGTRFDWSGAAHRLNVAPRAGAVVSVLPEGRAILRGGGGLFYERIPLTVSAFESFEERTITLFDADGVTPTAPPTRYRNVVSGPLGTPHGVVWNVEFDVRVTKHFLLRASHLAREGRDEFLIDPIESDGAGRLVLSSRGRSQYRESELTFRYSGADGRFVSASYVRSSSEADSNGFDQYFGNIRNPIIRPNQFSLTPVDVPNRLVVQAVWPVWRQWTVSPIWEVRDGFPFSAIDENQAFVGAPNRGGRFPLLSTFDITLFRIVTIRDRKVRIGARANHLFNTFAPRDAQGNVDSPAFGTFYNSFPRSLGFIVQLSPR